LAVRQGSLLERGGVAIKRSFSLVVLAVMAMALLSPMLCTTTSAGAKPEGRAVAYQKIGVGDYQNFLINWDEKRYPVLCALIRTPVQYDALFHPAAVMDDKRPFAPGAEIYTKEQVLMVGRVMAAPGNMDKIFEVERIVENGRELAFRYRFHEPGTNATFTVKNYLALLIPRHEYRKVIFFENGKRVGELKTAEGQWSVPAMTPEPNQTDASGGK
jgi:hypothetical protein